MKYRIVMENPGGELESRTATSEEDAARVLREMLAEIPVLCDGDVFRIIEEDIE